MVTKANTGNGAGAMAKFSPRQFKIVTAEMYRKNLDLAQINKTLSLLRTIDLLVLEQSETVTSLCDKISAAIIGEYKECGLAALYSNVSHEGPEILLLGSAHNNADEPADLLAKTFLSSLQLQRDWSDLQRNLFSVVEDSKLIMAMLGCSAKELQEFTDVLHLKDLFITPLQSSNGSIGALVVGLYAAEDNRDQSLLTRVGEAVSLALENKALQEENRRILQKLRASNIKLKALDETKDDFISMASHQLRTPLTSVKGYLSMVLEGDAGEINETQRKMLGQAYISSQRMVYLIADLLNVSRLRTGKFVIDVAPTDLSQMIDEEIGQLTESAVSRSLELNYQKPAKFPSLMLDETKTRQVLMNFIDNAIYYTPKGGHIKIELRDTGPTVEFRVTDDGIGVAKADQHHLFTKFYRAGNARQARPDGTGLGLFMAKKVISAQNGVLIFDSKEGKGSTFGFSFAKAKLQAAPTTAKL